MQRKYPALEWSGEVLGRQVSALLTEADAKAKAEDYVAAGDLRAEARAIAAVFTGSGGVSTLDAREQVRLDLARVIVGEGPEPWMVTTRIPDGQVRWGVINDANSDLTRLAEWSHAARYAMAHCWTPEVKEELGLGFRPVVAMALPERDPAGHEIEHSIALGLYAEDMDQSDAPERAGPDMGR